VVNSSEIQAKARGIGPWELCYVETESNEETWVHICLVIYYPSDGVILLLDEAQLPIDFEGKITFLWALPDAENRIATMGSYKLKSFTRKSWWQWWKTS
jgi:hypothetical protein